MSEKEQNVEELLAELFTEGAPNSQILTIKQDNAAHEKNAIQLEYNDQEISNDVLSLLSNDIENLTELTDENFEKLFRMKKNTLLDLQNEINDTKNDHFNNNLLLSLWILGNTAPFSEIAKILGVEENQIKLICESYFKRIISLSSKYITWPSPSEMMCLEHIFESEYELPLIIGALGCLHITVQLPENIIDCSEYYNVNSANYTVILQAVCDINLLFRDVFLGFPGNNNVEDTLKASPLYKRLSNEEEFLIKTERYLLAGTEHPQELAALLRPFPCDEEGLDEEQLEFNSAHSSAMSVLDETFHDIENRFQRIRCLDNFNIEFATLAVGAICVLNNFTRVRGDHM